MKYISAIFVSVLLSACSATTTFQSKDAGLTLKVNDDEPISIDQPSSKTYSTTSFGQYKFKASKEGVDPMYGLMPLKFNGGYLAADILFFAPAAFFNLRQVFPYYEFDIIGGTVNYKKKEDDNWTSYKPTAAEIENAKQHFGE